MVNIFYGYSAIWTLILFLYYLGWSDLCILFFLLLWDISLEKN